MVRPYLMIVFLFAAIGINMSCHKSNALRLDESGNKQIIALQPLTPFDTSVLERLAKRIESYYNKNTIVLPTINITEKFFFSQHIGYSADSVITFLSKLNNDSIAQVVGIMKDQIYTLMTKGTVKYYDEKLSGAGYIPGNACIVTDYRIQTNSGSEYENRLTKLIMHEIGHNLKLQHCKTERCVMVKDVGNHFFLDHAEMDYCDSCKKKLKMES